jgi:hypothetical protein
MWLDRKGKGTMNSVNKNSVLRTEEHYEKSSVRIAALFLYIYENR